MTDRIEINKDLIPYSFDILLAGETFNIRVDYNQTADMFTLALRKDDELVCAGEPIIYGKPLWEDVFTNGKYPALNIIPIDESGEMNSVTFDNLNRTVFLLIDDGVDEIA